MEIHLELYSILRDKLPPGSGGKAVIQLSAGAALADILDKLEITRKVVISVNGARELDMSRPLQDGDHIKIFSSISGG